MSIRNTLRAAAAAATLVVVVAAPGQARPGDAASFYTPRALNALGARWEAMANYYGKQSISLQKQAPVVTPISTSPPEGIEVLPGDESPPAPPVKAAECAYAHEAACAGE